jgi:hypothetical protein
MKNLLVVITMAVMISLAQEGNCKLNQANTGGVYSSFSDFLNHKLVWEVDCNDEKSKLKLNDLFDSPNGYVLINGQKHVFSKNQVYGYLNCKNESYRFYKNSSYKVMDTAAFFLYYQYKTEQAVKGKGNIKTDEYFFSVKGNDPIQPLTVENLKNSFPENHKFQYALDAMFKSDKELLAYDNILKMYKLKYLYAQSIL